MVEKLMAQLDTAADTRDVLEVLIEEETAIPEGASKGAEEAIARRRAMMGAVGLSSHAVVLRDPANLLKRLIPLECQALTSQDAGGE